MDKTTHYEFTDAEVALLLSALTFGKRFGLTSDLQKYEQLDAKILDSFLDQVAKEAQDG